MQKALNRWKKLRNRFRTASKDSNQPAKDNASNNELLSTEVQVHSSLNDSELAELRSQYSLSPVSKLPSDILATIFLINTSITVDFSRRISKPISQVCHFWRTVALECPLLWNYVGGSRWSLEWVTEMLKRSAIAPLDVTTDSVSVFKASLDCASRIRKMDVTVKRDTSFAELEFADSVAVFLQRDVEQLRDLSVNFCPADNEDPATALKVPRDALLFAGQAPQLRSINLHGCTFNFAASLRLFPKLTILSVGYLHPSISPTVSEWLSIFRCTPQLESLSIDRAIRDSKSTNEPLINLPHLRFLSIASSLTVCSSILSYIAINYTCNVSVHCSDTWEGPELQALMRILRPHLAILSENSSSHKLSLTAADDQIIIQKSPLDGCSHYLYEELFMSFQWREGPFGWRDCFPSLLPACGGYVAGPTVTALAITVLSSFQLDLQAVFLPWLTVLNNVKKLECSHTENIFSLLQTHPPDSLILLPSLDTFSIPAYIVDARFLSGYYEHYREIILEFIRWRSEKGSCIVKLVVEEHVFGENGKTCFIDLEPFEKLGVIVE